MLVICQEDSQFSRESQSTTLAYSAWYMVLWKKQNIWIILAHFSSFANFLPVCQNVKNVRLSY